MSHVSHIKYHIVSVMNRNRFQRPPEDEKTDQNENYEAKVRTARYKISRYPATFILSQTHKPLSRFNDNLDARFGYSRHTEPEERIGWMVNMQPTDVIDEEKRLVSAMDYYFIQG